MKKTWNMAFGFGAFCLGFMACTPAATPPDKETLRMEVLAAEQSFEKMAADSGIAAAFAHYTTEDAMIKRENDTLVKGRMGIHHYYDTPQSRKAKVNWEAEFVDVAEDGSMAYTYGHYVWQITPDSGAVQEYKGVFHTVWRRQADGSWKYVWD